MKSSKESMYKKSVTSSNKTKSTVKQTIKPRIKSLKNSENSEQTVLDVKKAHTSKIIGQRLSDKSENVGESSENKVKQTKYTEKGGSSTIYISQSNVLRDTYLTHSSKKMNSSGFERSKSVTEKRDNVVTQMVVSKTKSSDKSKKSNFGKNNKPKSGTVSMTRNLQTKKYEISAVEDEYEDDFEDYESDFQECTESDVSYMSDGDFSELEPIEMLTEKKPQMRMVSSIHKKTEEEPRFDSGHYEFPEARRLASKVDSKYPIEMKTNLKELPSLSDREEKQVETKSLPLSTDEGFEDGRSGDFVKSPPVAEPSLTICHYPAEESRKVRNRGKELMSMIKLDVMEHSLWECSPIPYEDFVRAFGKLNARQIAVQTNEDNLNAEIQTDDIEYVNKWTQFPVVCRTSLDTIDDIKLFKMEQIGVGGDLDDNFALTPSYDILKLNDFLFRAGKVIFSLLEKNVLGGNIVENEPHELPFTEGLINLSTTSLSFLSNRPVRHVIYSEASNKILITLYASQIDKVNECEDDEEERLTEYCIGCVWNICEPSMPIKIFFSRSDLTACCFHPTNCNIIFAGTKDGTINIWNLKEDEMWHKKVTNKTSHTNLVFRSPTFTTAGNIDVSGHDSEIVGISVLTKIENDSLYVSNNKFLPIQICTLDAEGRLIAWSVLLNMKKNVEDVSLSFWGEVKLNKSQEIPLTFKGGIFTKDCTNEFIRMEKDSVNTNNLYLATNTANVLHATCIGTKISPAVYRNNSIDWCSSITCIETCPFGQSYFFVGCADGTVRLHSSNIEHSLLQLKNKNYIAAVKAIQWSRTKPFCLYILDELSRIHLWDLGSSDILPIQSVTITKKGRIKTMQLSPCNTSKDLSDQYLAIGTDTGHVEIHKLNRQFFYSQKEDINREINAFLQYVSML